MPRTDIPLAEQGFKTGMEITETTGKMNLGNSAQVYQHSIIFYFGERKLEIPAHFLMIKDGPQPSIQLPFSIHEFETWVRIGSFDPKNK